MDATENSAQSVDVDTLILRETPRGEIELPFKVYRQIARRLPNCLRRGDDDAREAGHVPRRLLRERRSNTVVLQTRNILEISRLLRESGHQVRIERSCEAIRCSQSTQPDLPVLARLQLPDFLLENLQRFVSAKSSLRTGRISSITRRCCAPCGHRPRSSSSSAAGQRSSRLPAS
jgi:hypothetical protein